MAKRCTQMFPGNRTGCGAAIRGVTGGAGWGRVTCKEDPLLPPVRTTIALGVALSLVCATEAPALAETIYLKNGTRVEGKILKQTSADFQVQTANGNIKVSKDTVAIQDPPNPGVALLLGIGFPGAGNAYTNRYDRSLFYVAFTAISFVATFALVQLAGDYPSGQSLPVLAGAGAAAIPWGLGAYEAYHEARRQDAQPKYKIEYSTSGM